MEQGQNKSNQQWEDFYNIKLTEKENAQTLGKKVEDYTLYFIFTLKFKTKTSEIIKPCDNARKFAETAMKIYEDLDLQFADSNQKTKSSLSFAKHKIDFLFETISKLDDKLKTEKLKKDLRDLGREITNTQFNFQINVSHSKNFKPALKICIEAKETIPNFEERFENLSAEFKPNEETKNRSTIEELFDRVKLKIDCFKSSTSQTTKFVESQKDRTIN